LIKRFLYALNTFHSKGRSGRNTSHAVKHIVVVVAAAAVVVVAVSRRRRNHKRFEGGLHFPTQLIFQVSLQTRKDTFSNFFISGVLMVDD